MISVFKKAFHDSRSSILWLCIGFSIYGVFILSFFPVIHRQGAEFDKLLESYPKELMGMLYSGSSEDFSMTNPAIYLQTEFMTWTMLILGVILMAQAFNSITNAERSGSMDLMLTLPISRRNVLLGNMARTAITVLVVLTAMFILIAGGTRVIDNFNISLDRLFIGIYSMFFLLMAQACFTYFLASSVPSHKKWAGPIAYTLFFGAYLLNGFTESIGWVEAIQPIFLFKYYNLTNIIIDGLSITNTLVLLIVCIGFTLASIWAFNRKDIAV